MLVFRHILTLFRIAWGKNLALLNPDPDPVDKKKIRYFPTLILILEYPIVFEPVLASLCFRTLLSTAVFEVNFTYTLKMKISRLKREEMKKNNGSCDQSLDPDPVSR